MYRKNTTILGVQCAVLYPDDFEESKNYPALFVLNGAGSRGNKIDSVVNQNLFDTVSGFNFVVYIPLCDVNTWFDMYERLLRFVDEVISFSFVDKDRIYVMGVSMGGYCAWQLGMSIPQKLAAIVPICGGGMYWNARRLINVPVWAFHGEKDTSVSVEESKKMVELVNAIGGNAKLTIYENTYHDAWTPTYKNPCVFEWLLSIKNDNAKEIIDPYIDPKNFG